MSARRKSSSRMPREPVTATGDHDGLFWAPLMYRSVERWSRSPKRPTVHRGIGRRMRLRTGCCQPRSEGNGTCCRYILAHAIDAPRSVQLPAFLTPKAWPRPSPEVDPNYSERCRSGHELSQKFRVNIGCAQHVLTSTRTESNPGRATGSADPAYPRSPVSTTLAQHMLTSTRTKSVRRHRLGQRAYPPKPRQLVVWWRDMVPRHCAYVRDDGASAERDHRVVLLGGRHSSHDARMPGESLPHLTAQNCHLRGAEIARIRDHCFEMIGFGICRRVFGHPIECMTEKVDRRRDTGVGMV